ncbi:phytanoyl-CoA dioxygenase family protein [Actinoplanes awajinensis]|uniref:Phytanoyl-CoA dioxygenase n=1 Tax=Actinoplanes awajinensis subsp. mycoplanecinus TaxID=135947 RepID=A0A0X3V421_9ACTN|nr:phytanoyl-CoA dioxygenase family protein [Actinoplanes awajinensis]KUL39424.1 hypothetical protein ADL15_09730 [Actinoplanes awajinensis subsp. mycoplanecinus]WKD80527.1 Homoisoleucine hydroxylase [Actinoplanes awajinensis subsp. mycoplanecinus]
MQLSEQQIQQYDEDGFVLLGQVFSETEMKAMAGAFLDDQEVPGPHRVMEDDGVKVRAVYASHLRHPVFRHVVRDSRLLDPAKQILDSDVYVYQFKINTKRPFGGESWSWHQDYIVWREVDDLPSPAALNVGIFLDEVTEFNGPLIFLPGSQKLGTIEKPKARDEKSDVHVDPEDYSLKSSDLAELSQARHMTSPKGTAGSVVLFHPEIVHGSATNISPFSRNLLIITYNSVGNLPRHRGEPRAEYLVGRDTTPLLAVEGAVA